MNRRQFLKSFSLKAMVAMTATNGLMSRSVLAADSPGARFINSATGKDWLARWQEHILGEAKHTRYCDTEMAEELGWLVSPFLNGFYYGYLATGDTQWVERLMDWADSCIRRQVKEPDGYPGWPKSGTGGVYENELYTDSLLGEAMLFRPVVSMARLILKTPALAEKWGEQARAHVKLAETIFEKWDARGCWRTTKDGGLWVVPAFGIDRQTGQWSASYADRLTTGFSNPANKETAIARWLLALHDVTGKAIYRERATAWFHVMKSRMRTAGGGKYYVWNYWDPAGPWDYQPDGSTRHWVGVHPNGGYYAIDVEAIADAFAHGVVFTREDIDRLIATNRDFMWNQQVQGAKFQRIDGGEPDSRWQNSPGVLWMGLVSYDDTLRKMFVANNDPSIWSGLINTPWFLSLDRV